jgi:prepilin-type N-terminal cleavage/methylation domain-containing protein
MHRAIQRGRRRFGGQGGFTLFEVVMVLLILGVISYFASARLFTADGISPGAEMELVKNHLRYAQSRTMNTEKDWGITFEAGGKSYFLFSGDNPVLPLRLPGDESSSGKMILSALTITNAPITVRFQSQSFGSPGTAPVSITTTAGTITVTKNTGFIP